VKHTTSMEQQPRISAETSGGIWVTNSPVDGNSGTVKWPTRLSDFSPLHYYHMCEGTLSWANYKM
jgi:hypothetical protein